MNKIIYYYILLISSLVLISCQNEQTTNQNNPPADSTFGANSFGASGVDSAVSILKNDDNSILIAGNTNSTGAGGIDIAITRIGSSGEPVWSNTYGGSGNDYCGQIISSGDGGFIAIGYTNSFGSSGYDVCCFKIDGSGNVQWSKFYRWDDDQNGESITSDGSGGFVIAGHSIGVPNTGDYSILILKITSDGTFSSQKFYGGQFNDLAYKIIRISSGGFLLGGLTYQLAQGDGYLMKLNDDLTIAWSNVYGGGLLDQINDVSQVGNYFAAVGFTRSNIPDGDMFILEVDELGNILTGWPRTLGTGYNDFDEATCVTQSSDGTLLVGGYTTNSGSDRAFFVADFFNDGVYNWSRVYGGSAHDYIAGVVPGGRGFLAAGSTISHGVNLYDFTLINFKNDGGCCLTEVGFTPQGNSPGWVTVPLTFILTDYPTHETVSANIILGSTGFERRHNCVNP